MLQRVRTFLSVFALVATISATTLFTVAALHRITIERSNDFYKTMIGVLMIDSIALTLGLFVAYVLKPSNHKNQTKNSPIQTLLHTIRHLSAWIITISSFICLSFFTYIFLNVIIKRIEQCMQDTSEIFGSCVILSITLLINLITVFLIKSIIHFLMNYENKSFVVTKIWNTLWSIQCWVPSLLFTNSSKLSSNNIITHYWSRFENHVARPITKLFLFSFLSILLAAVFHEERHLFRPIQIFLNTSPLMRIITILIISLIFSFSLMTCLKKKKSSEWMVFLLMTILLESCKSGHLPSKYIHRKNIWVDHASRTIIDFSYTSGIAKAIDGGWILLTPYKFVDPHAHEPVFNNATLLGYDQDDFNGTVAHERGHSDTRIFWNLCFAFAFLMSFESFTMARHVWNIECLIKYIGCITMMSWCDELVADMYAGPLVKSYVVRGWGTVGARSHPPGMLRNVAGDYGFLFYPLLKYLNTVAFVIFVYIVIKIMQKGDNCENIQDHVQEESCELLECENPNEIEAGEPESGIEAG